MHDNTIELKCVISQKIQLLILHSKNSFVLVWFGNLVNEMYFKAGTTPLLECFTGLKTHVKLKVFEAKGTLERANLNVIIQMLGKCVEERFMDFCRVWEACVDR